MLTKIIATLLTGTGGHFLNKRWDKAILFICFFILPWLLSRLLMYAVTRNVLATAEQIKYTGKIAGIVSVTGILFIWLLSLIVTIVDAYKNDETKSVKWSISGIAGALLACILSSIFIYSVLDTSFRLFKETSSRTRSSAPQYVASTKNLPVKNFYEHKSFGGEPDIPYNLPKPPNGDSVLRGKFIYQNKHAENVLFSIVLNSKYRVNDIVTNAAGEFILDLPPGVWTINSVLLESWADKPTGNRFTIYSGRENKLSGNKYTRHSDSHGNGLTVDICEKPNKLHAILTISKDISLIWPDPEQKGLPASITNTIEWEKYPGANKYYVEIKRIKREGQTAYYETITSSLIHKDTSLTLKKIAHAKTKGKKDIEYAADIFAFSKDGILIAEFSDSLHGGTFILSDCHVLIEDDIKAMLPPNTGKDLEEVERILNAVEINKKRALIAEILIRDNMLNAARELLYLVDSEYLNGRKEALTGYIHAMDGDCSQASIMFDKAREINSEACIAEEYKADCFKDMPLKKDDYEGDCINDYVLEIGKYEEPVFLRGSRIKEKLSDEEIAHILNKHEAKRENLIAENEVIHKASKLKTISIGFSPASYPHGTKTEHEWIEKGYQLTSHRGKAKPVLGSVSATGNREPNRQGHYKAYNDTDYMQFSSNGIKDWRITRKDEKPFTAVSVDLAEYSTIYPIPRVIFFYGVTAEGDTVAQTFITDGRIDGPGGVDDFQTFYFTNSFKALKELRIGIETFAMDNLVLEDIP